jgi:regulator of protease activity HflC (stomatin/prohibitin superfamily)
MSLAPLHRRRGFRLAAGLLLVAAAYMLLYRLAGAGDGLLRSVLVHTVIALTSALLGAALIAQFLLPVRRPRERQWAIGRLLNHMLGERGPVTLVRDGRAVEAADERARRGPGVLLLDHSSAAVLRTDLRFTRALGPGSMAFTEAQEWLAASLDLRRQRRTLRAEPPATGTAADERQISALATTRDGVPVTATLQVTFMLERKSPLARGAISDPPPYPYSPQAIQQAVYGKVVHQAGDLPWSELPLRLAVDTWRELVKELSLNQLTAEERGQPATQRLEQQILARLTQSGRSESPASRLLEERGIRLLAVRLEQVHLPAEIRQERLQEWFERWAGPVQRELSEAEGLEREARRRGQAEASAALARSLTHRLTQGLRWDEPLGARDSLLLVFEGALEHSGRDPRLAHLSAGLREALDEIKSRDAGCREAGEDGR